MARPESTPYGEVPFTESTKMQMQQDIVKSGLYQLALTKPQPDLNDRRAALFRNPLAYTTPLLPKYYLLCTDDARLLIASETERIVVSESKFELHVDEFSPGGILEGRGIKSKSISTSDLHKWSLMPPRSFLNIDNIDAYIGDLYSQLERATETMQMIFDIVDHKATFQYFLDDHELANLHKAITNLNSTHRECTEMTVQFYKRWCNKV